ncbi:proliferation marker protein Ki-67 isoform X2 [Prionailurus bengalensis]|uniref:proliferation marker protein Ki-67 isoform X2 n=1 Tax=Prionailurus bengalensis TaxID=37029 RepID=UPI001CA92D2C|nr:proliferation marker protein Ki-67 isoform X2 [Prionailurus bengalensis]
MGPTGRLVTIKRSGADGPHFPLSLSTCLFGRGIECDIRIQLPVVSKQHCKIEINGREAMLFNFSSTNPTQVNGSTIEGPVQLKHGDVITVVDRSFRYENESHEDRRKSTEFPGQRRKQESLHRVSRSSLSSDPDGKLQDSDARSRASEDSVSGRPLKNVQAAGTVSGGCEDWVASRTPNVVHPSELAGGNSRNTTDPTGRDSKEDFSITLASCKGDLKPLPSTRGLENGANNESPFKKLYESMKEELDAKSEKGDVLQSGKKSGTRSHRPPEKECSGGLQGGTQVPGSLKSRPRSGRSTQMKADPALGEQGISQTEDRRRGEEAGETPKETRGPIVPPEEMTETKTLAQRSPQTSRKRQREDMTVASGSASVNLDQKEGFRTDDNKTFTPRKSLTRNQTPAKVENADNVRDTPENLFSKRRRSIPTSVDILTPEPETQNHAILAPLPVQVERKIPNSSVHQPEKVGAAVGRMHSGLPGRSSVDTSNFGDSINKTEGTPLKRRRVSFGGRLKPELFDENLPPNTPLKRGETPRRSLVSHTPPVLKKIIKDRPQASGKEDSSGLHLEVTAQPQFAGSPARDPTGTSPGARDPRRRSPKASSVSRGSKSHHTDVPKRGGRKSGGLLSKRTSIDRSQHDILQRIYSKRRSGASEANLVVAKSWADVVKLGAKQTQAKAVKHGPQRQPSKRPRKANTPKTPVSGVHSEFSTGHANSPCTIIIGKAHLEKVNVPARPYRMLNNFVINKKMDFNEDLSGLTEMFQTPAAKVKPQTMSLRPSAFSDSEDVVRKEFQVPDSGENPLLCTSETFGENVFPVTQNGPQEPSDKSLASPVLRRQSVRVNVNIEKTPGSGAPKATSGANRLRRSVGPRSIQMPGAGRKDEEAKMDTVENVPGRLLRKTPQREQKLEGAAKEQESYFEASENDTEPKENSEEVVAVRRSRRYSEQNQEPAADLTPLKTWQDTEPKEDLGGIQGLLRTPIRVQEPKEAENKTAEKRQKSSKLELAGTPAAMSIQLETPPQKVDLEEEPLALGKPIQMPGGSTHSHGEPAGGDRNSRLFNRTPEQKLSPAEKLPGSKRRPRTPKKKNHSLEDLAGLRELFQTPSHTDKPMTGHQTTKAPCKSPLPGPGNTPASQKRRLETPPQKVGLEEEPSALRKPTQTPGESTNSHREPGGDDEDINLFNKTPGQKPNPAVTGSKKRPRTPKKKAHSLEDLAGLRELFQTPNQTDKPMADDPTTKAPCKSPLAELVNTPASRRRLCKTPAQKVDLEKEASALQKSTQMPGESPHKQREPVGGDEYIGLFKETPKQELDPAENVAGRKRQSRTPKKKVQSLEDLVGLKELFQTPEHTPDPVTVDQTTRVPCKSPRAEPVNTPASRNRRLKTPQKVDLEEEPSALRKSTQMSGGSPHKHREPVGGDEDIGLFKETPKQELDPAENVAGSKRRPRTPKKKAHSLEDLDGLRGLFQTPDHTDKPMTGDQTTKAPCKSLLAGPGNTPASQKRWLETPPQKVGLEEKPSSLRKPTQMPGESTNSHREPGGDDEDINLFNKTPGQKPNPAVTKSKRWPRTPKKKAHSLEDLAGPRELFQTPNQTDKPMADDPTTKAPCKSPLAELVNTPASRRRLCKTPAQKVDLEEEASALQKSTQMPGGSPHKQREPVGSDEYIGLFKETPKQELDPAENVAGSKRRPRTPKKKVQSLEDLVGLKELFQTPSHTDKPMAGDQTTKTPCQSPLAGPGNAPASKKRQLETPPQKVGLEEEPPALGKSTQMPGESPHEHTESGREDKDIKLFNKTPEQKLKPADHVTGSKRRPRTPPKKVQSLEDLVGLKELFQTPEQTKKTTAVVKTTIVPCKSPLAETVNIPTHMKTRLKVALGKVTVENELSAVTKPTQRPEEATRTHREPVGEDEDIRLFKETPKQKLKPEEDVTGSKRQPRTPKKKVQSLEDLVGLKELFQTPDPGTGDQTTKVPCKSPRAEPVNTPASGKRWLMTPPQKVDLEEEPSALRKPTRMPGESPHEHREPGGKEEDINLFKETLKRKLKLNPTENVTGSKKQPRTPRRNIQSLEDLVGLKELFQTPNHTDKPMTGDQTTKVPCQSPLAGPGNKPTNRRRRLKTPPQKVDLEEEPSALRKPIQLPGESPHEHGKPVGGDADIGLFKDTPKPKLEPVRNVSRSKRQPRTPKKKIQSLEDLAGLKELFQTADPVTGDRTTKAPFQSPLAGPGNKPTNSRKRLKTPPQKADLKEEPSALRKPIQLPGESPHEHGKPVGGDADIGLFKDTPKPKLEPVRNVSRSKRQPRTPKKKIQSLEDLAGLKELFQTADPVTGDRTTKAPFQSPLAGPGNKPTNSRRRLKTPPQKADLKEEPSALRKPTQTPEESTHSLRESGGDDKDVKLFNRTAKQKLGPTENVTGRKNRPRAPNPTQPLEDLASFRESSPRPDHTKQRGDAGSIQGAPKQTPDGGKPVKPLARVRRAPRGKPVEDLAGHRDPVKSRSESSVSPSPKRKRGNEGGGPGTKRLRSVTPAQATAEEKPPVKKRRGAPREGRDPPEPLTAKRKLRIVAERMEVPGDLTSGKRESRTEGREVGRTTASPQQAMSLRSRRPNKTKLEEQRPEPVKAAADKVKTDRNDKKPRKTSQQTKPQSPEGRAKSSTPAGRVLASRMCLRSTRPRKVPLPDVAEEKQREKGVGVHVKNQEKEVTRRSDVMSLRSRKVKILPGGNALESESQQRVTRSAKRCAGNIKKDEDNACIKKIRTRSRRDNEDV